MDENVNQTPDNDKFEQLKSPKVQNLLKRLNQLRLESPEKLLESPERQELQELLGMESPEKLLEFLEDPERARREFQNLQALRGWLGNKPVSSTFSYIDDVSE
jgi:hypothetical protein